ncbi:MAG: lysozyme inhibitor LprI family protein [Parvibaculaceae bacterium]
MRRLLLVPVLAILSIGPAKADDCANASDQATMTQCADTALKKSDAELNALYKQIEQRLKDNADARKLLTTAQRNWVSFRDAECAFAASASAGGSVYPMVHAQCADGLTQARVKDFKAYLSCPEGDLSCPVPGQ